MNFPEIYFMIGTALLAVIVLIGILSGLVWFFGVRLGLSLIPTTILSVLIISLTVLPLLIKLVTSL